MAKKQDDKTKQVFVLTTEKCTRCLHPVRRDTASGKKVCANCGLEQR